MVYGKSQVIFILENVIDLELFHFSQNVIFGLGIEKTEGGYKITIGSSYGLGGFLEAEKISVDVEPGKPKK